MPMQAMISNCLHLKFIARNNAHRIFNNYGSTQYSILPTHILRIKQRKRYSEKSKLFNSQMDDVHLNRKSPEFANAAPYSSIPGPSTVSLILANLPGGKFYNGDLTQLFAKLRNEFGDLLKLPGVFGKPDVIVSHNPEHSQTIFRTEGIWPNRLPIESMDYFRKNVRPDLFGVRSGLLNSHGKEWGDFRTAVNPVMIQPKTVKLYIPTIDSVANDFLQRIRQLRNPSTNQLPGSFEQELNKWALESICVIAMDKRLGLISDNYDEVAAKFIQSVRRFFELLFELEFKPSLWRIVSTPKFRELMRVLNTMANISSQYIDEAKARLDQRGTDIRDDHEKSVLEKLLKIDPIIAKVMAMDMVFAGVDTIDEAKYHSPEFAKAIPVSKIPGPSGLSFVMSNLPGGKYYKKDFKDIIAEEFERHGPVWRFPGLFGKPAFIFTSDPDHFQTVFRTEGPWPGRFAFESMVYHREKLRPDIFGEHLGLGNAQGKAWADFRSKVNPVMMQPKTVKMYIPRIDEVSSEFLSRVRLIRNPSTKQLPANFEDELNKWSLESIAMIALDTRMGLISDKHDDRAKRFIESVKKFFELAFDLEFRPSLWKFIPTKNFNLMMKTLDTLTELARDYVDEAKIRLEQKGMHAKDEHEQSILEKLLKIDPMVAQVMAMDMVFAGVDTTSSGFTSVLYLLAKNPDKQQILRQEIMNVLPQKDSSFTAENMSRLPYLRACIKEAMRIHSVVNGNVRDAGQDLVLNGYQIPKGTHLMLYSPLLQMSDSVFPDAKKFLPERWLRGDSTTSTATCPASTKTSHSFVYLPFGFGPRMCIGKRLAEMEIEILLSKIVRNFYVSWEHPDLKFVMKTLNTPDGKLEFTLNDVEK